ncbi:hypothetical protein R3W88_016392 [Solanum pinnatisectum]|uniref:DUF4283 domain-containing protein n=1 Tax=Solanum pinnatisectum TaxID=50273 RepID=A0AAV9KZP0_9SOLN|nr:hypothetical protein R3W88_016392 [Solanum pinnatisectum]
MKSIKSKGETTREEQWPELTQYKGIGGNNNQSLQGINGTVTVDKSVIKLSMPEKTPAKPWANLFATNRMAARVEILAEDIAQDKVKWKPSVVVYVVGTTPSIGAMERFIRSQGNFSSKPVVLYHADGYFVVRFANEEERDRVLCSGPHYLLRRPVIMKPWDLDFNFKKEILTTIPLWIKLSNLPLNCWNSVVLSKIGNSLGKPLYADECTTKTCRISFGRILIEMDITRILPNMIKIQDPKGRVLEQQVRYEWKPIFSQKCLQVGHSCIAKPKAPPPKNGQCQRPRKEWNPTTKEGKESVKDSDQQNTTNMSPN